MLLHDCYSALGLTTNKSYTSQEIRRAYLKRAKSTHPDVNPQDPNATHTFQHLNQCYERVKTHVETTTYNTNPSDVDTSHDDHDYSVEHYRQLFEQWSVQASIFWNTSPEANMFKQLWKHLNADSYNNVHTDTRDTHFSKEEHPNKATSSPPSRTNALDIHVTVDVPLEDIYFGNLQKMVYTRYEENGQEHEHALLVDAVCKQVIFHHEGHRCPYTKQCGHVIVDIHPLCPHNYRIDSDTDTLHYTLRVAPNTLSATVHILKVFDKEVFLTLSEYNNQFVFPYKGLYDIHKTCRNNLVVDIIYENNENE